MSFVASGSNAAVDDVSIVVARCACFVLILSTFLVFVIVVPAIRTYVDALVVVVADDVLDTATVAADFVKKIGCLYFCCY